VVSDRAVISLFALLALPLPFLVHIYLSIYLIMIPPSVLDRLLLGAAERGDLHEVRSLLARGARPTVDARSGSSPLHRCAILGHREAIEALLEATPECIDLTDAKGVTPLCAAACENQLEVAAALLARRADANYATPSDSVTPLHIAASLNHSRIIELLLEHRAELELYDADFRTPLDVAATEGHEAAIKTLLERRADVNAAGCDGATPLFHAAAGGFAGACKLLLDGVVPVRAANGATTTTTTAAGAIIDAVAFGANVNALTTDRTSALMVAASLGFTDVCKVLLEHRADVNAFDGTGASALHGACSEGHAGTYQQCGSS